MSRDCGCEAAGEHRRGRIGVDGTVRASQSEEGRTFVDFENSCVVQQQYPLIGTLERSVTPDVVLKTHVFDAGSGRSPVRQE